MLALFHVVGVGGGDGNLCCVVVLGRCTLCHVVVLVGGGGTLCHVVLLGKSTLSTLCHVVVLGRASLCHVVVLGGGGGVLFFMRSYLGGVLFVSPRAHLHVVGMSWFMSET